MNYNERFDKNKVQVKRFFREEALMIDFINENYDTIEIIQIYTSIPRAEDPGYSHKIEYHLMYKIKEKEERVEI